MTRKIAWIIAASVLLAVAGGMAQCVFRRNRAVIVNLSGVELRHVTLTLTPTFPPDAESLAWQFPVIRAGESRTVAHTLNDSSAVLEFVDADGSARRHETPYIDLWTGEGWVFGIKSGGVVEENSDYGGLRPK